MFSKYFKIEKNLNQLEMTLIAPSLLLTENDEDRNMNTHKEAIAKVIHAFLEIRLLDTMAFCAP